MRNFAKHVLYHVLSFQKGTVDITYDHATRYWFLEYQENPVTVCNIYAVDRSYGYITICEPVNRNFFYICINIDNNS